MGEEKTITPIFMPNILLALIVLFLSIMTGHSEYIGIPALESMKAWQYELFTGISYAAMAVLTMIVAYSVGTQDEQQVNPDDVSLGIIIGIVWPLTIIVVACMVVFPRLVAETRMLLGIK